MRRRGGVRSRARSWSGSKSEIGKEEGKSGYGGRGGIGARARRLVAEVDEALFERRIVVVLIVNPERHHPLRPHRLGVAHLLDLRVDVRDLRPVKRRRLELRGLVRRAAAEGRGQVSARAGACESAAASRGLGRRKGGAGRDLSLREPLCAERLRLR